MLSRPFSVCTVYVRCFSVWRPVSVFLPTGIVAFHQFGRHVLYAQSLAGEQYNQMVKHVASLVYQTVVGAPFSSCFLYKFA